MRFEKVSYQQYLEDCKADEMYPDSEGYLSLCEEEVIRKNYEDIKLPTRATKFSAGYDFYAPYEFTLGPGQTIRISTGIRVFLDDDKFLLCAPRSGHGFKARIQLDNTVGIIDSDYVRSSNEGHILVKLTNDSHTGKALHVDKGAGLMQAIILQYFTVNDDNVTTIRDGGFGSTDKEGK